MMVLRAADININDARQRRRRRRRRSVRVGRRTHRTEHERACHHQRHASSSSARRRRRRRRRRAHVRPKSAELCRSVSRLETDPCEQRRVMNRHTLDGIQSKKCTCMRKQYGSWLIFTKSLDFSCIKTASLRWKSVVPRWVRRSALPRPFPHLSLERRARNKLRYRTVTPFGIASTTGRPTCLLGASVKPRARKPSPRAARRLHKRFHNRLHNRLRRRRRLHNNNVKRIPNVGGTRPRPRATKPVSIPLRRAATTSPASTTIPPSAPT